MLPSLCHLVQGKRPYENGRTSSVATANEVEAATNSKVFPIILGIRGGGSRKRQGLDGERTRKEKEGKAVEGLRWTKRVTVGADSPLRPACSRTDRNPCRATYMCSLYVSLAIRLASAGRSTSEGRNLRGGEVREPPAVRSRRPGGQERRRTADHPRSSTRSDDRD